MIEVENLTKTYKSNKEKGLKGIFKKEYNYVKAIKDISFSVSQGEKLGYIGLNGAGKSTSIKIMSGILTPTSGSVRINGIVPYKDRIKLARNIGVVFGQKSQLYWDLKVMDSYNLFKRMYNIKDSDFDLKMKWICKIVNIEEYLNKQVRKLSLGQRMICEIVAAFLHNPSVIFLDEPTIGIDVVIKEKIYSLINAFNKEWGTIFFITTHNMMDIERICDRIILLNKGEKIYDGDLQSIYEKYNKTEKICLKLEKDFNENEFIAQIPKDIKYEIHEKRIDFVYDTKKYNTKDIMESVVFKVENIIDINIEKKSLEDIIKNIYETGKDTNNHEI